MNLIDRWLDSRRASADATPAIRPPEAAEVATLRARWDAARACSGREEIERLLAEQSPGTGLDLRGMVLVEEDLSGLDLSYCDLTGADLTGADMTKATLLHARLSGADLHAADLTEAELGGAVLSGADLTQATLSDAGLGMANLDRATLFGTDLQRTMLTGASFLGADLRKCDLRHARARGVDFSGADLSRADLRDADLGGARVFGANLDHSDLREAELDSIQGFNRASWIAADIRGIDFTGAHLCRRHILDQNYLHDFKSQGPGSKLIYTLWWVTSDCGRSLVRWGSWTVLLACAFAGLYTVVDLDYGGERTPLAPLYFSVVTLTTLGYGDIQPASTAAQAVSMVEVIFGYVMLGGLLSIFSNKMARRAD
jgi:uncharacterized protein YjbI with pentapeptide repeats